MINDLKTVGPVLCRSDVTDAVVAAIRALNPHVSLLDRGAYVRIQAPSPCRLTRHSVEAQLGRPFRLPMDLECIMCSFTGRLTISTEGAQWT